MKKRQIHLYLTEELYLLLKWSAGKFGLPLTHFVKYILVKELEAHPLNLNIREIKEDAPNEDDVEEE